MKTIVFLSSALTALTFAVLPAKAQTTYPGTGVADGTIADGDGINSVVVNNDANNISFTINTSANMASYIFYSIEIQKIGAPLGDTSLINPWGPHVGASTGLNALINTYGTGASELTYGGGTWTQNASGAYAAGGTGSSFATITASLSSLGLNLGDSFHFDVVSGYTGGTPGQAAYGALDNTGYLPESDNSYQPWLGSNFYDSATSAGSTFSTTIYAVPEPGTCALMGLGALVMIRRLVRRNAR